MIIIQTYFIIGLIIFISVITFAMIKNKTLDVPFLPSIVFFFMCIFWLPLISIFLFDYIKNGNKIFNRK